MRRSSSCALLDHAVLLAEGDLILDRGMRSRLEGRGVGMSKGLGYNGVMKRAKISELRDQLSRYLDEVRRGETIEIVDRNVPVARVVPIVAGNRKGRKQDGAWIERLRRSGHVKSGPLKGVSEILKRVPPGPAKSGVLDALLSERRAGR